MRTAPAPMKIWRQRAMSGLDMSCFPESIVPGSVEILSGLDRLHHSWEHPGKLDRECPTILRHTLRVLFLDHPQKHRIEACAPSAAARARGAPRSILGVGGVHRHSRSDAAIAIH